ncbi:MAG: molybdopterin-guanine dinucleotide biosynthesis protein B [Desulfobacterales bacterium]|jgi:molybdopterin-guanine dinucleotide biosynthesis protein B
MVPIVSFVGKSNSGKTTVIEKLLPVLKAGGYRIAVIKHAAHGFEIDRRGKDSFRHKTAGADAVLVASPTRMALVKDDPYAGLARLLSYLSDMDLIITEGFKSENYPKIEVLRAERGGRLLCTDNKDLIAVVTDLPFPVNVPVFGLEEIEPLAEFIAARFLR